MITYENLRKYAYCNDHLIKGAIKGLCVEFNGLNATQMLNEDPFLAVKCAEKGILFLNPYLNPWNWMNDRAIATTDRIISVLAEHYGIEDMKVVSSGGSMGGQCSLIFARYSDHHIISVVSNCPVCDMTYHYVERFDTEHSIADAYSDAEDFEEALKAHSPLHQVDFMPDVPYHIFHCEEDKSVNKGMHSDKMVPALRNAGRNVTYDTIPGRGHCNLTQEMWDKYQDFVLSAFSCMEKEQFETLLRKWCGILRITPPWDVKLDLITDPAFRKTGDIRIDPDDRKAVVVLNIASPKQENAEEVLVHELMHLKLYPLDQVTEALITANFEDGSPASDFAYTQFFQNLEITVEELTKCFLAAFGESKSLSFGRCEGQKSFDELYNGLSKLE